MGQWPSPGGCRRIFQQLYRSTHIRRITYIHSSVSACHVVSMQLLLPLLVPPLKEGKDLVLLRDLLPVPQNNSLPNVSSSSLKNLN